MSEPWIPNNYPVDNDTLINEVISSGDDWQILSTYNNRYLLVITPLLFNKIGISGLNQIHNFNRIDIQNKYYYVYLSSYGMLISHIQKGPFNSKYRTSLKFAEALKQTREYVPAISLYDAIFVEDLGVLFPTFTNNEMDDEYVLGTWVANGECVSSKSFKTLNMLTPDLNISELAKIIEVSSLDVNLDEYFENENSNQEKEENDISINLDVDDFHLPGRPVLEKFFREHIIDIIRNKDKYKKMGIEFPSATILYGPPGCGKTYAVEKLSEFIGWKCYSINSSTIGSSYIHETSKLIAKIFDSAIKNSPSILIIDEMDAYLSSRELSRSSGISHTEEVAEFLRKIPEAVKNNVLIFAMTNRLEDIDIAILRKGRFDNKIEVSYPTENEVEELLSTQLKSLPLSNDIDISVIAKILSNRPLSDIAYVVRESGRITVSDGKDLVDNESIRKAIDGLLCLNKVNYRSEYDTNLEGYQ